MIANAHVHVRTVAHADADLTKWHIKAMGKCAQSYGAEYLFQCNGCAANMVKPAALYQGRRKRRRLSPLVIASARCTFV